MQVLFITEHRNWSEQYTQLARHTVVRSYQQAKAFANQLREPLDAIIYDGSDVMLEDRRLRSLLQDAPLIVWQKERSLTAELYYLQAGAQHYCSGTVSVELMAVYVKLAQGRAAVALEQEEDFNHNEWPWLGINPARHLVTLGRHNITSLTATEFKLFHCLLSRPGQVKNRDQLMDVTYDEQVYVDDRTVDSHIKRLRQKLRKLTGEEDAGNIIETLYSLGYRGSPGRVDHLFAERAQLTVLRTH